MKRREPYDELNHMIVIEKKEYFNKAADARTPFSYVILLFPHLYSTSRCMPSEMRDGRSFWQL